MKSEKDDEYVIMTAGDLWAETARMLKREPQMRASHLKNKNKMEQK